MRNLFLSISVLVLLGLMFSSQAMAVTRHEQNDPDVSCLPSLSWHEGPYTEASGGYLKFSNDYVGGASCSFTFTGTFIAWIGLKEYDLGISEVWIDGKLMAKVDLYDPGAQWNKVLYTKNNLTRGTHTITIKPTNQKNSLSSGLYTVVDAFDVFDVCPGTVCVVSPNSGDLWTEGKGYPVSLAINTAPSQYRLYRKCGTETWSTKNIITMRMCDYYGVCPDSLWAVPYLVPATYTTLPCQIAVQLLDKYVRVMPGSTATSDIFLVESSDGHGAFYIDPLRKTVQEGSSAGYEIKGGTPPYLVATLRNVPQNLAVNQALKINLDITEIDYLHNRLADFPAIPGVQICYPGHCSSTTTQGCTVDANCPLLETCVMESALCTFTVKNNLPDPCVNTTVVIGAQDSEGHRTFSLYNIECP